MDESRFYEEQRVKQRLMEEERMFFIRRKYTLNGILLSVIGLSIILIKEFIYNALSQDLSAITIAFGGVTLATGVGLLLYSYLQTGIRKTYSTSSFRDENLGAELEQIRLELIKLKRKSGDAVEQENLTETINNIINNTIDEEFLQSKIESAFSEQAIEQSKLKKIYEDFENLDYRISAEINRLRRSANLNLVIGTLTTALAIIALGYEVFGGEIEFTDTVKLLSHYLPRLSIIVFIEIFAFFFLKLYKASLDDIKYFNNEKTNIDFKLISLRTAIHQGNQELIKLSIEELVKTERNFKLGKDETTVEIQKLKADSNNNNILAQVISKLTDKL